MSEELENYIQNNVIKRTKELYDLVGKEKNKSTLENKTTLEKDRKSVV